MQGIFRKENTDKALKYGIYRHLPTYEKIIRNLVSFYLKNEDVILSLSTKEYEKMFDLPIIQLDFVIRNGHTFKRNAVYLKKARGMMLNYLIEHHIEDIKQIKEIVIDDYHFSENDSNDDHWVFIKNEKMKYIKK